MGRISLYEQSKLPSAVSGYRTSAAPEVAALENVSQSIGQLGQSYLAMKDREDNRDKQEAHNAFTEFSNEYKSVAGDIDLASKNPNIAADDIDALAKKRIGALGSLKTKYGAKLSKGAAKYFDEASSAFLSREEYEVPSWTNNAKTMNAATNGINNLYATASSASATTTRDELDKTLADIAVQGGTLKNFLGEKKVLPEIRKANLSAVTSHIGFGIDTNPAEMRAKLEGGQYDDLITPTIKTRLVAEAKQAALIKADDDEHLTSVESRFQINRTATDLMLGKIGRGQLAASSVLDPNSPDTPIKLAALQETRKDITKTEQDFNAAMLAKELVALNLEKKTNAKTALQYKSIIERASIAAITGEISHNHYRAISAGTGIVKKSVRDGLENAIVKTLKDSKGMSQMYTKPTDNPVLDITTRGFKDMEKKLRTEDGKILTPKQKETFLVEMLKNVTLASETQYGTPEEYAKFVKRYQDDPDKMFNMFVKGGKEGMNFDIYRRSMATALGKTYSRSTEKGEEIVYSDGQHDYIKLTDEDKRKLSRGGK